MRVSELNTNTVKPVTFVHDTDKSLVLSNYQENFNFGLSLHVHDICTNIKDSKTNFNTNYLLTDTIELSSFANLNSPYSLSSNNVFETYIKNNGSYWYVAPNSSTVSLNTSFNSVSSNFFFTIALSTENFAVISYNRNDLTYYLYLDNKSLTSSTTWPSTSSGLFRYIIDEDKITLFNEYSLNDTTKLILKNNSGTLTAEDASMYNVRLSADVIWDIKRTNLTKYQNQLKNTFSYYLTSYNNNSLDIDPTTTFSSISNNYLVYGLNRGLEDGRLPVGFIPLKNQSLLRGYQYTNNYFNSEPIYLNRVYDKIHSGLSQSYGYDKLHLSYNIGTYNVYCSPDKLTYFNTVSTISPFTTLNVNKSLVTKFNGTAGDNPLISDKIFKRRENIKRNSFSDTTSPQFLCTWLSGDSSNSNRIWVDRYYNPLALDFNKNIGATTFSYLTTTNTTWYKDITSANAESTYVFDVSSNVAFEPNNDYAYYHIGKNDYKNLLTYLNKSTIITNPELLNSRGVSTPYINTDVLNTISLNGDTLYRFTTKHTGSFSFGFELSAQDFSKPFAYKLLGNYFEEGFAIFNTDLVTPNIILPIGSQLYFLNNDLEVYNTIQLIDNNIPIQVKGIARKDNFTNYYVLGQNNVVYVFSPNNNIVNKITTLSGHSVDIDDIDVTEDKLYMYFTPASGKRIFYYDFSNNTSNNLVSLSSYQTGEKGKVFTRGGSVKRYTVDSENGFGNEIAFDSNDTPFLLKQKSPTLTDIPFNVLQKSEYQNTTDNTVESNNSIIQGVVVDDTDHVITIYDNNRIARLDNNRKLLNSKELTELSLTSQKYIDLIYDFENGEYKKYILIIEKVKGSTILHKFDFNFNHIKTSYLNNTKLNNMRLTKSVTSYYYLKKYGASKNRIKAIFKFKPKYSINGVLDKTVYTIDFNAERLSPGYNSFFYNVDLSKGKIDCYINNLLYKTKTFPAGKYLYDNILGNGIYVGAVSTPYYLTLANLLQQDKKYFVRNAYIRGFVMYDRPLSYYEILAHTQYFKLQTPVVLPIPCGQRTYIDTIDSVSKVYFPEKASNKFNLRISGSTITDPVIQQKLRDNIQKIIPDIIPYYNEVNEIIID